MHVTDVKTKEINKRWCKLAYRYEKSCCHIYCQCYHDWQLYQFIMHTYRTVPGTKPFRTIILYCFLFLAYNLMQY